MPRRNAPAKINLGLHVLRKRSDGYHEIETVFIRIPWADTLRAEPAADLRLRCTDPDLPVDDSNLVVQAARALLAHGGSAESRGASLVLEKHLPYGAGLGGGSSDAAATLLLLNEMWAQHRSHEELHRIAASIGSDVPFFLGPEAALGRGRGDLLEPLVDLQTDEPYRPAYALVVVVPPVKVATGEAYASVTPRAEPRPDLRELVLSNDLARWRRELVNDFEEPVFARHPSVREAKAALEEAGAGYASLTGSGAAVYGFFDDDEIAEGAAEGLRKSGIRVWHGRP